MRSAAIACLLVSAQFMLVPATAAGLDCTRPEADMRLTRDGHLLLARSLPMPPPIAAPFALDILICRDGAPVGGRLSFDARMPAHGHGMNYRPRLTRRPQGEVRIEGLLLHMPGFWEATVTLREDGRTLRFTFPLRQQ